MYNQNRIQPFKDNPAYWQYKGKPVLLIGASNDDNLYQWVGERLTDHLDLLQTVGGNYVRNTMSDRDSGNVYPFKEIKADTYDLDQWNDAYWERLSFFLEETKKREIIPQITLWDQHDLKLWNTLPWNPKNNINYEERDLEAPASFTKTVTDQNHAVLTYQNQYIEKLMEITLQYDHCLYNINNESWAGLEWENYWATVIHQSAAKQNKQIEVTTMHMHPSSTVRTFLQYPELYSFVDISQINQDSKGEKGQAHWDEIQKFRNIIHARTPVPMNHEKIYGDHEQLDKKRIAYNTSAGTTTEAVQRFWRDIFGGSASARFHRNEGNWGMGLSATAQNQLRAMDLLVKRLDVFACRPANHLLTNRNENGCYCFANVGIQYAVYFPEEGSVELDPWVYNDEWSVQWLLIDEAQWKPEERVTVEWVKVRNEYKIEGKLALRTPGSGSWVALIEEASGEKQ
ncbi:hypothetical protein [Gracilibacillus salinarum]|uniref:DUF4038 domain-containing protein n=1 Tax=Gracilibacillus salinarum TaxID=2932255 RepID=A0ABY4GLR0_9BACI|nr:hypothetical protein [Gracilibacillus salinarum]UOQ84677.1 hypothetical protein MUN87_18765 [Gracilibacillus salinarum]